MSDQITHQLDPDTGHMRQIVPPQGSTPDTAQTRRGTRDRVVLSQ